MAKRIAINGFGRIGRLTFRNLLNKRGIEIVAINDLTDNKTLAHLLKYDTAHGQFDGTVKHDENTLIVNRKKIHAFSQKDPSKLPWKKLKVDVVLECTGFFRTKEKADLHRKAGAKSVVISAPAKSDDVQTIVLGVNDEELNARENIFSNASCTTNCLAPLVKILEDNWGVEVGSMTTTHAYTGDQRIQDAPHADLRRGRAAACNIVPTTTGAAKAVAKVIPSIAGKLSAMALRVPVVTGSLVELNVILKKEATVEKVNATFKKMSRGAMKGVLEYCEDPVVSSDIVRNPHSSIFDSLLTSVNGNMLKVVSWYDNEAGYSARLADLCVLVAKKKPGKAGKKIAKKATSKRKTTTKKATTKKATAEKATGKRRGRPAKKKAGRPAKSEATAATAKKRGRPAKKSVGKPAKSKVATVAKKRGRPAKKSVGRPAKSKVTAVAKKRGRPAKRRVGRPAKVKK